VRGWRGSSSGLLDPPTVIAQLLGNKMKSPEKSEINKEE